MSDSTPIPALTLKERAELKKSIVLTTQSNTQARQDLKLQKSNEENLTYSFYQLTEKRNLKSILEEELSKLLADKSELIARSSYFDKPTYHLNDQLSTIKHDFENFKQTNTARITTIQKGCSTNIQAMMNKVSSLKTEVSNLEIQVQSKRLNERMGVQSKVSQYDSAAMKLNTEIDEYERSIIKIESGNQNLYSQSVSDFEEVKVRYTEELTINSELKKRSGDIADIVSQLQRKLRNKEHRVMELEKETDRLDYDLRHIHSLKIKNLEHADRYKQAQKTAEDLFSNQKIKHSHRTADLEVHSKSSTGSGENCENDELKSSKQEKSRKLEQMLYDAIKLTNDKLFEFEKVIDIFVEENCASLGGEIGGSKSKDYGSEADLNDYYYNTLKGGLGSDVGMEVLGGGDPMTVSKGSDPRWVKGLSSRREKSGLDKRKEFQLRNLKAADEQSFDREKRQILDVCNDLSREIYKMKNQLNEN